MNYVEAKSDGNSVEYLLTPECNSGQITISKFPRYLRIKQIGVGTYPCRTLYSIDFNRYKIFKRIKRQKYDSTGEILRDSQINSLVNEYIEKLERKMPFRVTVQRDSDDIENLVISSILDREGNDIIDTNLEIHIQSLGVDDKYWLDSGAFDF